MIFWNLINYICKVYDVNFGVCVKIIVFVKVSYCFDYGLGMFKVL